MIALRRIVRFLRLADREAEASAGLSAAQLYVLRSLADAPAQSLGELAERTLTDQSSVSTVVAKLAARRLVTRIATADDRRRISIRLTAAGQQVANATRRLPQTRIADAVRAMPLRRRGELVRSLDGLVAAIGADRLPARMLFEDEPRRSSRSRDHGKR
ncbi:MAG TPA: MarR family transcriptional regulator [Kofleriaceae bacterium]|nr:MarR family transcriptional regulator [Kofleriaceae bacterium]